MQGWHIEPRRFQGTLAREGEAIEVGFTAGIADTGEARVELDSIERTAASKFIETHWKGVGANPGEFALAGVAEDGAHFQTDNLFFTTLREDFLDRSQVLRPIAHCSYSRLSVAIGANDRLGARLLLRGFRARFDLVAPTPLGEVVASQTLDDPRADQVSGEVRILWPEGEIDLGAWRVEAERLFKRIRYALSFASGVMIGAPISEFTRDGRKEVEAFSRGSGDAPYLEAFQAHELKPIYDAAIRSHFEPPMPVEKLDFAIEWLVMAAPYAEGRLIAAMTALENLVSSNLAKEDIDIQDEKGYEKLRKALSNAAKEYAATIFVDVAEQKRMVAEINDKFRDLNRRTLRQKIETLGRRWSIDMAELDPDAIGAAKRARDLIVHSGSYPHMPGENFELFDHVVIARELVTRFVLAALGYEGSYGSYVGRIPQAPLLPVWKHKVRMVTALSPELGLESAPRRRVQL